MLRPDTGAARQGGRGAPALRVLIVEDSEDDTALLLAQFARAGRAVEHRRVDSADGMRDALLGADWDVVISDHAMPAFSSSAALRILRESGRSLPFIIYSGCISDEVIAAARRDGVRKCIAKDHARDIVPAVEQELGAFGRAQRPAAANLLHLADYDRATGLPLRGPFMAQAARRLAAIRPGERIAVCMIDLARFGRVDQALGGTAADRVLGQIARRLRGNTAATLASRLAGDKFVLVCGGFSAIGDLQAFAGRTIDTLASACAHSGLELHLASSMGISICPDDGSDLEELVLHAETAMLECKRLLGRNGFLFYFPGMEGGGGDAVFRGAPDRRQAGTLRYQPVVALDGGAVVAVQGLDHQPGPPELPFGDGGHATVPAGGRVTEGRVRAACRDLAGWRARGLDFAVSVAVPEVELMLPALPARLSRIFHEMQVDPQGLMLEIGESALRGGEPAVHDVLRALKGTGVAIAVADFGLAPASPLHLRRYPFDALKIDPAIVRGVATDARDASITRAIVGLGRCLGLRVYASGADSEAQVFALRESGCDGAQGCFFGMPLAAADVPGFIYCRPVDNSGPA